MDKNVSRKNYGFSVLLVFVILFVFWLLRLYIIPIPESQFGFVITIDLLPFVFCIVIGIVIDAVFLLIKRPIFLVIIAIVTIFTCLLCDGSQFTDLFAIALLCFLGSIPFIASLLAKMGQKA